MSKKYLLMVVLLMGLVFNVIPQTKPIDWFLASDVKLTLATHVYFIFEKLTFVFLGYIIYAMDRELTSKVFFFLMIADLTDYLLTYGSIWFTAGIPVSMNTIKVIIFGLTIAYEWYKSTGRQYFG